MRKILITKLFNSLTQTIEVIKDHRIRKCFHCKCNFQSNKKQFILRNNFNNEDTFICEDCCLRITWLEVAKYKTQYLLDNRRENLNAL